jgi:SNF2 family DNA or RNA helicase
MFDSTVNRTPGERVRHIDDPARIGTVTDRTRQRSSGRQVQVDWGGRTEWHYDGELLPAAEVSDDVLELIREGQYGRAEDLRRLLTHVHLSGRLANVVYAMGLTQTDFYPHQYKPLLTLLDSPVNGLLIADEVGLGKTIEAGLIWTELRARYSNMRRLLVVCPAMLREKWRMELSRRFGLDPRVVDASELTHDLQSNDNVERAWIGSYQGLRVPKHWLPAEGVRSNLKGRAGLADLLHQHSDQEPLFDLVIFDEAHYMRNEETSTWRTGSLLRDLSAHQVMLSATPINLGSQDLCNLLRLLDPDHFEQPDDFRNIVEANIPVVAASDKVRNPGTTASEVVEAVRAIRESRYFESSERVAALIDEAEATETWTDALRVDFAARIERLNLLAHIVSRTRKREVQTDRVVRDAIVAEVDMSAVERSLYRAITEGTREYALRKGIGHGFLLSMPQRMVASCPAALVRSWREGFDEDALAAASDDGDQDEIDLLENAESLKQYLGSSAIRAFDADELARCDTKYAALSGKLRQFLGEDAKDKAILFTTFRSTARYLSERLSAEGIGTELLMGGGGFDKDALVQAFCGSVVLRVLVCTDVAAEGVDLQFCRLVINYDLPWNPMRIEQRIGRIDRIGQLAKRILIWNFVHNDTIDARILERLTQRIGIFESALGATEEILGHVRALEDALLSRQEAELIQQATFAIQNIRSTQEELEQQAIQLVAHGQQLLTQIELARGEDRIVTSEDLFHYVDGHLRTIPGNRVTPVRGESDTFEIGLGAGFASELDDFLRQEGLLGKTGLASGQTRRCQFSDKITHRPVPGLELIHRFHPLVRFVAAREKGREDSFPLYAIRLKSAELPPGRFFVETRLAEFTGVKDEDHLLVVGWDLVTDAGIDERNAEALLAAARRSGSNWPAAAADLDAEFVVAAADQCDEMLRAKYTALAEAKRRENKDRAEVLIRLLVDHVEKKKEGYERRIQGHEYAATWFGSSPDARRRKGLANAERKKLVDFLARMEARRASLTRKNSAFRHDFRNVCTLVVDVSAGG